LIGGVRSDTVDGVAVAMSTANITVANSAAGVLSGPDIILAAEESLTLEGGAVIEQRGALSSPAQALLICSAATAGSGNGALLRVSSDESAELRRSGVTPGTGSIAVGAGVSIAGTGIILDSTGTSTLDPTARLPGVAVTLSAGQISLQLDNP